MDKNEFERWALGVSSNFKRNKEGQLTWYLFPFWDLQESVTREVIKHYKNISNKES